MRISTFFAATLPEAIAKVREELGPKAVVLSWRATRGGIEISASAQASAAPRHNENPREQDDMARRLMENRQAPQRSESPHTPSPKPFAQPKNERLADHFKPEDFAPPPPQKAVRPPVAPVPSKVVGRGAAALLSQIPKKQPQQPAPQSAKLAVQRPAEPTKPKPAPSASPLPKVEMPQTRGAETTVRLQSLLMRAGLSPDQARTMAVSKTPELRRALTESIFMKVRFDPIEATPARAIILVGPPGAGKTATAAKLAARALSAGTEVSLMSADSERCGGADQLRALSSRLGAQFGVATTVDDVRQAAHDAYRKGVCLFVDAASANPTQPAEMRSTARLIEETGLSAVLVLPADMRPDDMDDLVTAYRAIGVTRVIGTRLDLTNRRASLVYAVSQGDMALAQISATPYISGGVAIATANRLASLILDPFEDALAEDAA